MIQSNLRIISRRTYASSHVNSFKFKRLHPSLGTTIVTPRTMIHDHTSNISFSPRLMVTVTKSSASSPVVEIMQNSSNEVSNTFNVEINQDNDSVKITASAIQQINHLSKQRRPDDPSAVYLRVYVDAGGCSGFQYKFELEQKDDDETPIDPDEDVVINASLPDGSLEAMIVIDESSLEYIKGSTVDFVKEMIRSSFAVLSNPQSESACGCGTSFAVKNFEANPAID
mmetsp:Transcript_21321/g.26191  ORF Transcript_21321/g.26191 Transcript_21321/m.26191 type:complete len:227 (-) Transcript_21321:179-859(-)